MKKIAVLVIDKVEEIECLSVVDFCRRAGIEVTTVSVTGKREILGSHNIPFSTDALIGDVDFESYDGIVFPGGAGTAALGEADGTRALAEQFLKSGKLLAAICAAPGMLSETGLLEGRTATGFPGCKPEGNANWTENPTETDGNLVTGRGAGCASLFALEIIRYLLGDEMRDKIAGKITLP